jgi:glycine dehydrogenase subunit 1
MSYIPNTPEQQQEMARILGLSSPEELFREIPDGVRLKRSLNLPPAMSELELRAHLEELAGRNTHHDGAPLFLGGGCYDHFIPTAVDALASRGEFLTAYTPYQAEASQGLLQAFFEYQSLICELTGMDVSNASMYDGATAMAEAALMAHHIKERPKIVIARSVHPEYRQVLQTYLRTAAFSAVEVAMADGATDLAKLESLCDENTCAVIVQHPNFFGCLEPVQAVSEIAHRCGALLIACVDPISLGVLKPPGAYGADIVVGDGQSLGLPPGYGGPHFGFMACRQEFVRRMPGRLIGETIDRRGQRAFVLTLQTREQHIRREKATSNICTNHALCALRATIYLTLMGKAGLRQVASLCAQKSHYALEALSKINGVAPAFKAPFFKEFAVRMPRPVANLQEFLLRRNIIGGLDVSAWYPELPNTCSFAVTERRTRQEIDALADAVRAWIENSNV